MTDPSDRQPRDLTPEQWEHAKRSVEAQGRMLFRYAAQVIIGSPETDGIILYTGSGFLVRLLDTLAFATADHVVGKYEEHQNDPNIAFQVGNIRLRLKGRPCYRSAYDDVAFLQVTEDEAAGIGSAVHTPPSWPPALPQFNDFVTIVGLPP